MDRGAWRATVHGVAMNQTRLSVCALTHTQTALHKPLLASHFSQSKSRESLHKAFRCGLSLLPTPLLAVSGLIQTTP